MQDILLSDLQYFQQILHVKPGYSQIQLFNNYKKIVKHQHPALGKVKPEVFEATVVAYEVLKYQLKQKRGNNEKFVREWNQFQKTKITKKIEHYKKLKYKIFISELSYNTTGFLIFKTIFTGVMALCVFILVFIITMNMLHGAFNIIGIIFYSLIALGLIVQLFRKNSARIFGDYRYYKY
jgi:hypothetical protein